jgi:hypothetical protein
MRWPRHLFALGSVWLLACGGDDAPLGPSVADVAGSYTATSFTSTQGANTTDLLAAGSTVTATLAADGTTTGRLFVPAAVSGGLGTLDEDLRGTWQLTGSTVTFSPSAATLLGDLVLAVEPNRLRGEDMFAGATLRITLTK